MVPAAANAFLKLLEEPPAGWVIILLAANVNRLLPTIMSRVVQLRFQAIEPQLVEQELQARQIEPAKPRYWRVSARLNRLGAEFSCSQGATGCI